MAPRLDAGVIQKPFFLWGNSWYNRNRCSAACNSRCASCFWGDMVFQKEGSFMNRSISDASTIQNRPSVEEILNAVTHGIGAALSVAALVGMLFHYANGGVWD